MSIAHKKQRKIWNLEHKKPHVLLQMDSEEASGGVVKFWNFLKNNISVKIKGLEMGCGKGRNVIWLAKQGVDMRGFDFSDNAIKEAKKRAKKNKNTKAKFLVADATKEWPWKDNTFDFGLDCFASTDIETFTKRKFAINEMNRVIKPGGYVLAYLLSTRDEFHKGMIRRNPAQDKNSFFHDSGKFEKVFSIKEVADLYKNFRIVKKEIVKKTTIFFEKEYKCYHHWIIFQKHGNN